MQIARSLEVTSTSCACPCFTCFSGICNRERRRAGLCIVISSRKPEKHNRVSFFLQYIRARNDVCIDQGEASMHSIRTMALLVALIAVTPMFSWAAEQREPMYMGKPLSYWIESLR